MTSAPSAALTHPGALDAPAGPALPDRRALPADADAGPGAWPIGTDSFFQPRRAAFWLLVVLLANGAVYIAQLYWIGLRAVPVTSLLGLAVWAVYTVAFVYLFRVLELLEQLPTAAFVLAFAWGGLGAVYLSAPANVAIQSLAAKLVSPEFMAVWGPALAGPITEEFFKLAGVMLIVLVARNQFPTELSVLVIGAMVGLGFQVVENLSYTVRAAISFPIENQWLPVLLNLVTRGLLGGLWSHAAYTTVASFGLACAMFQTGRPRVLRVAMAVAGFAAAWAMHFAWNSPWLEDRFPDTRWGLAALLVVKGLPVALAAALVWRAALREEGRHLQALAAYLVPERELLSDDEWMRLGSPLERLRVRRDIGRRYGRKARRLKARLQREQLRLVMKAGVYGRGARTERHELAIRRTRARLDRLPATA